MIKKRRRAWRPDWRLWAFCGLLLPVLIGLGIWQLHRATEKQQQLEQWQQAAEPHLWGAKPAQKLQRGEPVMVEGYYTDTTWLLDNRTRNGVTGYEVLTLFKPVSGQALVVNRGWVQAPPRRTLLPVLPQPVGIVSIAGRMSEYPEPPLLAETTDEDSWPRRVQALTEEKAQSQSSGVAALILRLKDDGQPGAFKTGWTPNRMGPQTHYGYAAQWFALALALLVLTTMSSYRKPDKKTDKRANNDNHNG